ncbi:serine protease [Nocardioides sp. BSK12Z-3]|nr:serine protease [Nocardioides bruguierae]
MKDGETVALVTAAHVAPRAQPTDAWASWPKSVTARLPSGGQVELILFEDRNLSSGGTAWSPAFLWRPTGRGDGSIEDILILNGGVNFEAIESLASEYPVFELPENLVLNSSSPLRIFGYPVDVDMWPEEVEVEGRFIRVNGRMIEADLISREGHSGGPCLDDRGNLVGMIIGSNQDHEAAARIVPATEITSLLKP